MNSISNERFAERIFVTVGTMDREAVAGMDGHLADLEVFAEADHDSAGMEPLVFPGGDDRPHDAAGTEPFARTSSAERAGSGSRCASVQQRIRGAIPPSDPGPEPYAVKSLSAQGPSGTGFFLFSYLTPVQCR